MTEIAVSQPVTIRRICDAAPVQYEGTVGGCWFFFRAGDDRWHLAVADTLIAAAVTVDAPEERPGVCYRSGYYGEPGGGEASHMGPEDAERLIYQCLTDPAQR